MSAYGPRGMVTTRWANFSAAPPTLDCLGCGSRLLIDRDLVGPRRHRNRDVMAYKCRCGRGKFIPVEAP